MARTDRLNICFVSHNALGALTGHGETHSGGIERQQALMAKWLASRSHRVSMVVWDEESTAHSTYAGVELFRLCRRSAGLPGLRFFYPRWSSLASALARANADIYYYNCGDLGLGQVAMWARSNRKRLVYSVASDASVDPALPGLRNRRERVLYRYGLHHCDAIITQSQKQQRALEREFSLRSTVLPMPCEGVPSSDYDGDSETLGPILWVGRISAEKRPDWLLDIAEELPQRRFELVGAANKHNAYSRSILERARGIRNVALAGRVPYDRMGERYRRASILCSTSVYEGFPNIFLEAWSAGIPVVATCDPDGLITGRKLGFTGQSVSELSNAIDSLAESPALRREIAANSRAYFRERHTPDRAMQEFVEFFRNQTVSVAA